MFGCSILPEKFKNMINLNGPDSIRRRQVHELVLLQKYADIITDSVFKKLFGDERFPDLMLFLLQELIPERTISSIKYAPQEHQNDFPEGHGIRVDVECYDETTSSRFAVEMQALKVRNYHDRLLAYSTYIIQEQFGIGILNRQSKKWDYSYPQSYVIALMDYDDNKESDAIRHEYAVSDIHDRHLFTDRVKFITLELPKYHDPADSNATALDKFCYAMHNMKAFKNRPEYLEGKFFELLFEKAEIAKFAPHEVIKYEKDMLTQWDIDEYVGEQVEKGMKEGMEKGMEKGMKKGFNEGLTMVAKNLLKSGMKPEDVAKATTLSLNDVHKIENELNG